MTLLLATVFALPGAAGLVYESIWTRHPGLFVGHGAGARVPTALSAIDRCFADGGFRLFGRETLERMRIGSRAMLPPLLRHLPASSERFRAYGPRAERARPISAHAPLEAALLEGSAR